MSSDEDHPAVRAALARGVPYVAMVASRRRTAALVDELRAEGVADEVIARLKSPAGLDIGAATGPEIALSILAEIVQRRRARRIATAPAAAATRRRPSTRSAAWKSTSPRPDGPPNATARRTTSARPGPAAARSSARPACER